MNLENLLANCAILFYSIAKCFGCFEGGKIPLFQTSIFRPKIQPIYPISELNLTE